MRFSPQPASVSGDFPFEPKISRSPAISRARTFCDEFPGGAHMSTSDVMLRRECLKKSAAGGTGLVIGLYLPGKFEALAATPPQHPAASHPWSRISPAYPYNPFLYNPD